MTTTVDNDKLILMAHKTDGVTGVTYYVTNLPSWWEMLLICGAYSVMAMTVFYTGLWIASRFYLTKEK